MLLRKLPALWHDVQCDDLPQGREGTIFSLLGLHICLFLLIKS